VVGGVEHHQHDDQTIFTWDEYLTMTVDKKEQWWDRFCTVCGWRGTPPELFPDETAESFYRCPLCRIDADEGIQEVPWHKGDKRHKGR
jgi:hypothetical protein